MCYKKVILFLLYFILTQNLTDITTLNCPADFEVANVNKTGTSMSDLLYSSFSSPQNQARVQAIVVNGDTQDLSNYLFELMIPYIIISVTFFIFFLIVICCCVFDKICPPCQSWRRDFKHRPYQKFQLRCVMVFGLIISTAIFATSITTLTFIPSVRQNLQYTKCSLYMGLDIALNGDQENFWGGFSYLSTSVNDISSLVTSAQLSANTYIQNSSDEALVTDMNRMKYANLDIYNNNKDSGITTPNPDTTSAAISNNNPLPLVDSVFIQTGLGPQTTNNTMVNNIDNNLKILQKLSLQGYKVIQAANIFIDSTSTIQQNTKNSKLIFQMYLSQLNQAKVDLDLFSAQYFDQLFNWGLYVIEGVIGFILAGSLLSLIGIISTHFFDIMQCRAMVHIGWVIYGITYVGILALLYIFVSAGSIGHSFCNYYQNMLTLQSSFDKLSLSYSQNIFAKLDVCMFGQGDILDKFDIAAQMQTVTNLYSNIQTYNDYSNQNSVNFVPQNITNITISGWINAMENYRLGIYKDTNDALTTNDNANQAIEQLNLYSNEGGGVKTCSRDRWVFDVTNCTDSTQHIYKADSTQSNAQQLNPNHVTCISLNSNYTTSTASTSKTSSGWTQTDLNKRYLQIRQQCTDAYNQIMARGGALINFRQSRNSLFTGIKDQLVSLEEQNQKFIQLLENFKNRVSQFSSATSQLNNRVTSKNSGLVVSADCRIISAYMRLTYNLFCVNFINTAINVAICCLVLTLLNIGGLLTGNVFAVRYGRVEILTKMIRPQKQQLEMVNHQSFQKRQYFSSSSSSSQQD